MADHQPSLSTPKLDWQEKFEAVLLEDKPEKAPQLVADAEAHISPFAVIGRQPRRKGRAGRPH
jgi:hypothetical protein